MLNYRINDNGLIKSSKSDKVFNHYCNNNRTIFEQKFFFLFLVQIRIEIKLRDTPGDIFNDVRIFNEIGHQEEEYK